MNLDDLKVYNLAMEVGERVWIIVDRWTNFQKDTIGKQFVRATDSIAANLSEGFGRYHYKEAKNFGYYSRGSLYETKTWLTKAYKRNLVSNEDYNSLADSLNVIVKMLNSYIKSIGDVNEPEIKYGEKLPSEL
ncbi:four helix bundle protein [Chryseosolibacter indicus]|uniref:Four helix bundle protein n=1 Tax=Chryseosolibacter indicus TaxID=2782351 RepID=A0ABS5VM62_9BACT|nr:four helix bundle protein [Chryseosolibacter indicus]MBT1701809.1 four helix bundle protein [Chryseosolibacter indicus]